VEAFLDRLVARQITAVVRKNRGGDIAAACGQLAAEGGPGDPRRAAPAPPALDGLT
jgi:23S rRNA (adenine2503-C2)-methyltransferase